MKIGLGIRLGRNGGGGDTSPPVITGESYNSGTNVYSMNVSEAGIYYALWSQTSGLSKETIKANALAAAAYSTYGYYVSGTTTNVTVDDSALAAGTWYFQYAVYDFAGNGTLGTQVTKVVSTAKTETWASYANGDTYTQLSASALPYTRNSANVFSTCQTDANAATGATVGLKVGLNSGTTPIGLARNDITTLLAARTTSDTVEVLARFRTTSTIASASAGLGWLNGTAFTGIRLRRAAANANAIAMLVAGDLAASATNSSTLTGLVSGIADGTLCCARFKITGDSMYAKAWTGDLGSEPGTPTTGFTQLVNPAGSGIDLAFSNLGFYARTSNDGLISLGYSTVLNATAPSF